MKAAFLQVGCVANSKAVTEQQLGLGSRCHLFCKLETIVSYDRNSSNHSYSKLTRNIHISKNLFSVL